MLKVAKLMRRVANSDFPAAEVNITEVDVGVVTPQDEPEFPKPVINLLLGFILALALGVSAALAREVW